MAYFVGLDASLEETAICVVDDTGAILREGKAASEPEAISTWLGLMDATFDRVGLEAGPLSPWLHEGLTAAGASSDLHRDAPHEGRHRGDGGEDRPE